ncbi:NUMOD4 domain-containing protein [Spirosoma foliorum]|uniref:NUMOD4 domain-containing protein n=1 Tax=Spirosoma foliorum TaxID=2710596 RepID=A0A7G5GUG0_9BACT|nr:NUMOD4 domain-containing protein [Spirosoma foliorum]QMW02502.1 hypothetical protein H3H32_32110 [Spirosoma foliorum]
MNTVQMYTGKGNNAPYTPPTAKNGPQAPPTPDDRQEIIWKPFPGLENFFEVSNLATVRHCKTGTSVPLITTRDGQFMSLYHPVTGKYVSLQIHRAVATAFLPNPNSYSWVSRKDGDKRHNVVTNLEWIPKGSKKGKEVCRG